MTAPVSYLQTIYPSLVQWGESADANKVQFTSTVGGIVMASISHGGREVADYTGNQEYPGFVWVVDQSLSVRLYFHQVPPLNPTAATTTPSYPSGRPANQPFVFDEGDVRTLYIVCQSKDQPQYSPILQQNKTIVCLGMKVSSESGGQPHGSPGSGGMTFVHEDQGYDYATWTNPVTGITYTSPGGFPLHIMLGNP